MATATAEPVERQTLTVDEAATYLGISRWLAFELVKRGELPTVRIGQRRLVVPRAALDRMLEGAAPVGAAGEAVAR